MLLKVLILMSSFSQFLARACKQPAVYWGTPRSNGRGGFTYATPIEIQVLWNDRIQVLSVDEGDKIISRAFVYVLQDVDVEGLLYKGTLASLTTIQKTTPASIENGICIIKRFENYPGIGASDFVRIAFLTPWLT